MVLTNPIRAALRALFLAAAFVLGSFAHAATTTDYSDLWWVPAESGWGIQLVQEELTIFATMFVYDSNGQSTWYTATLSYVASLTWSGALYATTGPWFGHDAVRPDPGHADAGRNDVPERAADQSGDAYVHGERGSGSQGGRAPELGDHELRRYLRGNAESAGQRSSSVQSVAGHARRSRNVSNLPERRSNDDHGPNRRRRVHAVRDIHPKRPLRSQRWNVHLQLRR